MLRDGRYFPFVAGQLTYVRDGTALEKGHKLGFVGHEIGVTMVIHPADPRDQSIFDSTDTPEQVLSGTVSFHNFGELSKSSNPYFLVNHPDTCPF